MTAAHTSVLTSSTLSPTLLSLGPMSSDRLCISATTNATSSFSSYDEIIDKLKSDKAAGTDLMVMKVRQRNLTTGEFSVWLHETPWRQAAHDWDYFIDFVDAGHLRTVFGFSQPKSRTRLVPIQTLEGRITFTFSWKEIRGWTLVAGQSFFEPRKPFRTRPNRDWSLSADF